MMVLDENFRGRAFLGAWPQGWFYNEFLGPASRGGTTRIVRRPGSPFFELLVREYGIKIGITSSSNRVFKNLRPYPHLGRLSPAPFRTAPEVNADL